jgi:hypothetical protein
MQNIQKPSNNLVLAIIGTVLFWPVSLWGLLKAVKVNRLWDEGKHEEAIAASKSARTLGLVGTIVGGVITFIFIIAMVLSLAGRVALAYTVEDFYEDAYYSDRHDYGDAFEFSDDDYYYYY